VVEQEEKGCRKRGLARLAEKKSPATAGEGVDFWAVEKRRRECEDTGEGLR